MRQQDLMPEPFVPVDAILQSIYLRLKWWMIERKIPEADRDIYDKMICYLDTPEKVQGWMYAHLTYNAWDVFDCWLRPEITFRNRFADCEDWAIFANACLERVGRIGFYVLMYATRRGVRYGHCSYVTRELDQPERTISLGTYGLKRHWTANWERIVEAHSGYSKWEKIQVLDASKTREAYLTETVDRTKLPIVYEVSR